MSAKCVRVLVYGRVQGVFFRQTMRAQATMNSVYGWVRNMKDGGVEAVLYGDDTSVDTMVAWCRRGPAGSIVDNVEVQPHTATETYDSFSVLY